MANSLITNLGKPPLAIIVVNNVKDDTFYVIGPFPSWELGCKWADEHGLAHSWVAVLTSPENHINGLDAYGIIP